MFMDPTQFGKQFMEPMNKQFYEQMEKTFVEKINEMMLNPSFLSSISKGVESGLDGKKKTDDVMKNYLEKMNMPTRDDTARVLQYLQKIESRIIGLEEKLEDLGDEIENLKKKVKTNSKEEKVW